jgi:hypothetical protein
MLLQKSAFYRWFVRRVLPFAQFPRWGEPDAPMDLYFQIRNAIGNDAHSLFVFAMTDRAGLSYWINRFLTGARYSHVGVAYLDVTGEVRAWHSTHAGLVSETLLKPLRHADKFELRRLPLNPEKSDRAWRRLMRLATSTVGVPYDFDFQLSREIVSQLDGEGPLQSVAVYCSELIWLLGIGLVSENEFKTDWELGRETFEPDDVVRATWEVSLA